MSLHRLHRMITVILAIALIATFGPATPASAIGGSVVVKSLLDTDDATMHSCTLREALQGIALYHADPTNGAKATYHECTGIDPNINTITFQSTGKITINSTLPFITSNISITGPIQVEGAPAINQPLFRVATNDAIFSVANMTLSKGRPAIYQVSGIVNVAGVSFVGNNSGTADGGAIVSTGKLNIAGSNFTGNRSEGSNGGGAIAHSGSDQMNIAGSVFNGNTAKRSAGAIYAAGPAKIVDTIFNGNISEGLDPNNNGTEGDPADDYYPLGGGAIQVANTSGHSGKVEIVRSVFNGNLAAPKANAGALYNSINAIVEVRDSSFNGNLSGSTGFDRLGGAILNAGGDLSLDSVTLLNNGVTGDGGAMVIDRGNAIVNLTNVTIVANAATGKGGGIYALNTQQGSDIRTDLVLRNVTISLNVSTDGGGIYGQAPSSSFPEPHKLANTILADNLPANCSGGPFTSLGHNLDSGTSCGLTAAGDLQNANAALEGPFFNGGPLADLLTQKLGAGSAALDAGDPAICAAAPVNNEDQRGEPRGGDGNGDGGAGCDIGAYEGGAVKAGYGSTPVQPGPIDIGNVQLGTTGQASFTIFNTGNKDLQLGATVQGPGAAEFAIVSFPATVPSSAPATVSCSPAGSAGQRTANLVVTTNDPDQPVVSYTLLCNGTPEPVAGFGSTPAAPGPIDFGSSLVGVLKNATLIIQETGNAPLAVNTAVIGGLHPGDFGIGAVNLNLPDGEAPYNLSIQCTPSAPGLRSATLTLNTNDPTQPTVLFNLSCTGKQPPTPILQGEVNYPGIAEQDAPYGLALSPDGRNLYVANETGDALVIYDRDLITGNLSNPRDVPFLDGAIRVLVSPDGQNVYVTDGALDDVRAYARDASTGNLTFIDSVTEGDAHGLGTVRGLDSAYGMALSSDGKYLYVAGRADGTSPENRTILVLRRDADGGLKGPAPFNYVNFVAQADSTQLINTYDLAISPDGAYLYAANYLNPSASIVAFKRNASTGALTAPVPVGTSLAPELNGVFRLEFSLDGNFLYAASFNDDAIVVLKRNSLNGTLSLVRSYTNGGQDEDGKTISGLDAASSAKVSQDGKYLFTTGYNSDAVSVFERDEQTGRLVFVQAIDPTSPGSPMLNGTRDLAIGPDARTVYASAYLDDQIVKLVQPNPVPALTSLSPASVTANPGAITLTVNGSGFVQGAVVRWNNAINLTTEFISSSEVRASVGVGLVSTPGPRAVTVINPAPGGGTSNALTFTVTAPDENPVPSIEQIAPQGSNAGGPAVTLTVTGAGFIPSSVVYWNGAARPTTFISPSTLQAEIGQPDVAQPGTAAVTVVNPGPGGGTSNAVGFTVAAPGENPPPALDRSSPASTAVGQTGGSLTLTLYGAGFVEGAQARWDGADRPTTFVDSEHLLMEVSGTDVDEAGQHSITVTNPAPGGGESNAVAFTVVGLGENPIPSLGTATVAGMNPDGSVVLNLDGFGFVGGAQARLNGADRPTALVSDTRLTMTISAADYIAGSAIITVDNPAPGGGRSNELLLQLYRLALPMVFN